MDEDSTHEFTHAAAVSASELLSNFDNEEVISATVNFSDAISKLIAAYCSGGMPLQQAAAMVVSFTAAQVIDVVTTQGE